jgi:hypothetical protein
MTFLKSQRRADATEQDFAIKWLAQVTQRTSTQRPLTDALVRESGNKDYRGLPAGRDQFAVKLQAARTRHLHVCNQS